MSKSKHTRARKAASPRSSHKPRKPRERFTDVDGHLLSAYQYEAWKQARETRMAQGYRGQRALDIALDDVLSAHRPSNRAKDQLHSTYRRAQSAITTLGHSAEFPYRIAGNSLKGGLAVLECVESELFACFKEVIAIRNAIAAEKTEFLQDWLRRAAEIEDGQHAAGKP